MRSYFGALYARPSDARGARASRGQEMEADLAEVIEL
jgi:hypothetical protein